MQIVRLKVEQQSDVATARQMFDMVGGKTLPFNQQAKGTVGALVPTERVEELRRNVDCINEQAGQSVLEFTS